MRDATIPVIFGVLLALMVAWLAGPASPVPGGLAPAWSLAASLHASADTGRLADGLAGGLLAEAPDVEERVVAFDANGALTVPQRDSLLAVAVMMRDSGVVPLAEMCAPRDPAARERFLAAIAREFGAAGMPAWRLQEQPAGCSLPLAVMLRPA
jgi:hypothetical protein